MEFVVDTPNYSIVSNKTPYKVLEQYIQHLPNIMNPHVLSKMLRGTEKQRNRVIKEINKASYETAIQSSLKQKKTRYFVILGLQMGLTMEHGATIHQ